MEELQTLKGRWIDANLFIDEYDKEYKVLAYKSFLREWEDKFPLECYIMLDGNIIRSLVEV